MENGIIIKTPDDHKKNRTAGHEVEKGPNSNINIMIYEGPLPKD